MRFGIYAELQCPDDKPYAELYDEIVRQMVHADEVGFDAYSIIEHHFFQRLHKGQSAFDCGPCCTRCPFTILCSWRARSQQRTS